MKSNNDDSCSCRSVDTDMRFGNPVHPPSSTPHCTECWKELADCSAPRCKSCEQEYQYRLEDDYRFRNQLPPYAIEDGEVEEYDRTHPRK